LNAFFKKSNHKQLREKAENWLRLAEKVYHFRKDIIAEDDLEELHETSAALNNALKKKGEEDWGKVRLASEELEAVLKRKNVGGYFYPQNFWAENAEMFLVAAIVALAIRTFFLQPFKIPTNSMYPSYNGMTQEVFEPDNAPGGISRVFRFLSWGAVRKEVYAEDSGEATIRIANNYRGGLFAEQVPGRKWLIFPTTKMKYSFYVGNKEVSFVVPAEFTVSDVFKDAFFPDEPGEWDDVLLKMRDEGKIRNNGNFYYVSTGKTFNKGDKVLSFDIMTGDALFVDRISYHFKKPDVGEAIVFKTENIPNLRDNKYYIKRLVGTPGDVLQVKAPALFRNGEPITGATAFDKNAHQDGKYSGYSYRNLDRNDYLHDSEATVTIPEDSFFAMGDNSPHSSDSRFWGFVPKKEMVGRAIFIYYPFSHRWGLAN
jgi:signal peptidase I